LFNVVCIVCECFSNFIDIPDISAGS
jgi:hypothetical protein